MTTSTAQSQLWLWFLRTTVLQTRLDINLAPGLLNLPPSIYSEKTCFFGVDGDWIFSAPVPLCETAVNLRHFLEFSCCQPVALSSLAFTPKSRRISEWMGSPICKAPRRFKKSQPNDTRRTSHATTTQAFKFLGMFASLSFKRPNWRRTFAQFRECFLPANGQNPSNTRPSAS
jgi:hypothetical protein